MKAVNLFRSYEDSEEDPLYSEVRGGGGDGDKGLDSLVARGGVLSSSIPQRGSGRWGWNQEPFRRQWS